MQKEAEKPPAILIGFFIRSLYVSRPALQEDAPEVRAEVRNIQNKNSNSTVTLTATQTLSHPEPIVHLDDRVHVTNPHPDLLCRKCLVTTSHFNEELECWTHLLEGCHEVLEMLVERWATSSDRKSTLQGLGFTMGLVVMEDDCWRCRCMSSSREIHSF